MSLLPFSPAAGPNRMQRNKARIKNHLAALRPFVPELSSETFTGAGVTLTTTLPTFTDSINPGALTAPITFNGAVVTSDVANNYRYNSANAGIGVSCSFSVNHYGSHLAFVLRAQNTFGRYHVWVDGKPLTALEVNPGTLSQGATYYLDLPFSSAKHRHIELFVSSFGSSGIRVERLDGIGWGGYRPLQILEIGDSWGEGASDTFINLYPRRVARYMNADITLNNQGGTGYVNDSGGNFGRTPYGSAARRVPMLAMPVKPDFIWVEGSINDLNKTGIQAAATALYARLNVDFPGVPVFVSGCQSIYSNANFAGYTAVNDAIKAAVATAPNVVGFIDARVTGDQWLTGTGSTGSPTGDGNCDQFLFSDGAHLVDAGHEYYARRTFARFAEIVATW